MDAELSNAVGITPACAGKSAAQSLDRLCAGDHPRVCGEKVSGGNRHQEGLGSPPRMRGKVISSLQCDFLSGITPACAGKRKRSRLQRSGTGDHPRVCGEKMCIQCSKSIPQGSPPRMRGKGVRLFQRLGVGGITPACAGKSAVVRRNRRKPEDHPRVCGEKSMMVPHTLTLLGSPPRMRGKVTCTTMSTTTTGDHPRVCGEKFTSARGRSVA